MSTPRIFFSSAEIVSPAGWGIPMHLAGLLAERSFLLSEKGIPQGRLASPVSSALRLMAGEKSLRNQDILSQLGVLLVRSLTDKSRISKQFGVIFGSSRGATHRLESSYASYQLGERLHPLTSPTTTAGSLPAAIARDLNLEGPSLSVSAACSTGLHAIIQAAGSIKMGLAPGMVAGGAEFANTDFTLQMLLAAKVHATDSGQAYPCRPGAIDREGMVLSEGAAALLMESEPWQAPLGELVGWGAATETSTLTGISADGAVLVKAIGRALETSGLQVQDIDLIIGHGAGTKKGDAAEMEAYQQTFSSDIPIVWHKWMFGHMLGGSACASLILGMHHLNEGRVPPHPYLPFGDPRRMERRLIKQNYMLVTALGFGGNAAAIIVKNPALNLL